MEPLSYWNTVLVLVTVSIVGQVWRGYSSPKEASEREWSEIFAHFVSNVITLLIHAAILVAVQQVVFG